MPFRVMLTSTWRRRLSLLEGCTVSSGAFSVRALCRQSSYQVMPMSNGCRLRYDAAVLFEDSALVRGVMSDVVANYLNARGAFGGVQRGVSIGRGYVDLSARYLLRFGFAAFAIATGRESPGGWPDGLSGAGAHRGLGYPAGYLPIT